MLVIAGSAAIRVPPAPRRALTIDIEIAPQPPRPPPLPPGPTGSPVVEPAPARRTPSARKPRPTRMVTPEPASAPEPTIDPGELAAAPGGDAEVDAGGGEGGIGGGSGIGSGHGIDIDLSARPIPLNASQLHTLPYTEEASRARISGSIVLLLAVDPEGRVGRATVRRGLGHGLDEIAIKLAMQIRFRPALDRTGKPTAATVRWGFQFRPP
jgi:periplasmic protein TonB